MEAGHVRVNGQRTVLPAKAVALGDVLTVALEHDVKVLRIVAFAERRGAYKDACLLYETLKPGAEPMSDTSESSSGPLLALRPRSD